MLRADAVVYGGYLAGMASSRPSWRWSWLLRGTPDEPDLGLRVAVMVAYLTVGAGMATLWGGLCYKAGFALGAATYGFAATLMLATGVYYLATRHLRLVSNVLVVLVLASTAFGTYITGGLRLANVTPFFLLIIASLFLLGRRGVWAALLTLGVALAFELGHWAGYEYLSILSADGAQLDAFITWFSMATLTLLSVWAYESARERSLRSLAEANQTRVQFLANISHELRTPLHVLTSTHELLIEGELSDHDRDLLLVAREHVEILRTMVDDLLDVAAIERGRFALRVKPFQPERLVRSVGAAMETAARLRGLYLRVHVGPSAPEWVSSDERRLRQVLVNLVSNALKFTESGGIDVSVERGLAGQLVLSVRDTGIGIDPKDHRRIFDSFTQVDGSLSRAHDGAGLGLFITQQILAQLGGRIEVDSVPGGGSTFRAVVPYETSLTPDMAAEQERAGTERLRVLVVDDNEDSRDVVEGLLEVLGHTAVLAADAEQALTLRVSEDLDLILMDVQMPHMDGFEATQRLRAMERTQGAEPVPVVAMTGHCGDDARGTCLDRGMTACLFKPFTLDELRDVLRDASDRRGAAPR